MPAFVPDVPYHIQLLFIVTFGFVWGTAFYSDPNYLEGMPENNEKEFSRIVKKNTWSSVFAIGAFMMSFAYLRPYVETVQNQWMQRLNRVVVALTQLYLCWLIFILHQRPDFGRQTLGLLDYRLNQPIAKGMHTYDDDCSFTWENFSGGFDHYYLVHLGNWLLSSFVIRDTYILHFQQLFDEIIELSAQHHLPHFRECWWDHIIQDILMSNTPSIIVGMWLIEKFGIRKYDWLGRDGKQSIGEWEVWYCHRRFGLVFFQFIMLTLFFLDGFYLMNALLIPPVHEFPVYRLLLWFAFGAIAHREVYQDIESFGKKSRKTHPVEARYRWLSAAILCTEMLIAYKYRKDTGHLTDDPTPIYIWLPWLTGLSMCSGFYLYLRFKKDHTVKYPGYKSSWRLNLQVDYPKTDKEADITTTVWEAIFGGQKDEERKTRSRTPRSSSPNKSDSPLRKRRLSQSPTKKNQ